MKLYLSKLTTRMEVEISNTLLKNIPLVFDKQTTPEARHVALFAQYRAEFVLGYQSAYLAFSMLEDETTQGSDEYVSFLNFVLELFGKSSSNVMALMGNKCSVSQNMSDKIG